MSVKTKNDFPANPKRFAVSAITRRKAEFFAAGLKNFPTHRRFIPPRGAGIARVMAKKTTQLFDPV